MWENETRDDWKERKSILGFIGTGLDAILNFFTIKPTRCTNFANLFWHETLHVSDSFSVHHQEFIHCYDARSHERKRKILNVHDYEEEEEEKKKKKKMMMMITK
jgi:hypothetical protein